MKIILAISGGVDSMAMLNMTLSSQRYRKEDLVVAHFDHGIRENSAEDAEFVQRKARKYGIECRIGNGNLGTGVSEAVARKSRYEFLYGVRDDMYAESGEESEIWTAHHLDDLVESVVINFIRGTGWRGLAVLDSEGIRRPFLDLDITHTPMDKERIFAYAASHELEYREDPSNSWDEYLRNRIRHQTNKRISYDEKNALFSLWQKQKLTKARMSMVIKTLALLEDGNWRREWFRDMNKEVALELLREGTMRRGVNATRPQLEKFRQAILHYTPGKYFNLPGGRLVKLGRDKFQI